MKNNTLFSSKENTPFFAIVGPVTKHKRNLYHGLQEVLRGHRFLTDAHSTDTHNNEVDPLVEGMTELAKKGYHESAPPHCQLLFFWSRLLPVIQKNVVPCLANGTPVIIKGFGGSVLANAMLHSKSQHERDSLVRLHKNIVNECILGADIPPPKYLFLKTDPGTAMNDGIDMEYVATINHIFAYYGTLPGQTVITLNADQHPDLVLKDALSHIMPQHELELAV